MVEKIVLKSDLTSNTYLVAYFDAHGIVWRKQCDLLLIEQLVLILTTQSLKIKKPNGYYTHPSVHLWHKTMH